MGAEPDPLRVRLWNAVTGYTASCNGDTSSKTVSVRRMQAVVAVEKAAFFDAEPVTPAYLLARGAVQDPEHLTEWLLPWDAMPGRGGSEESPARLVIDLSCHPGVCFEVQDDKGRTLSCETIILGEVTVGRFEALCYAIGIELKEKA